MTVVNSIIILPQLYQYASEGWRLFPVGKDKKPLTEHGFKDGTQLQARIKEYFNKHPGCNWGAWFPGQFIIDIDVKNVDGFESLARLEARFEKLPRTRTHGTPSGGKHFIYRQPSGCSIAKANPISKEYPGIDLQANDCYIVLPPSQLDNGEYIVIDDSPIIEGPKWLCDFALSQKTRGNGHDNTAIVPGEKIPQGQNDSWLISQAGRYRRGGDTEDMIFEKLKIDSLRLDQDPARPYTDTDLRRIAKSAGKYPAGELGANGEQHDFDHNQTDTANAEYFTGLYKNRLRYDHRRERWLEFTGHYYVEDKDAHVERLGIEAIRNRYRNSVNIADLELRKKVAAWCIQSEQRPRLQAMEAIARVLKPLADSGIDFDDNQWLLAVPNGVIDLKTGTLRPGKPEDRITQHSNIPYLPDAPKPVRFIQFLDEIFNCDRELIDWTLRALGYSLTGCTREQVIFILYGNGANGKSKLLDIIRHVLGPDYAYNAPFSTFELDSRSTIPNDLAALERRRFVTALETMDGSRFNESRIKALSGEDDVTARYLNREFFTFKPVAKIWLGVNHKPRVSDDSYGFWRRVRLIPFTRQFKGKDEDKNLFDKLKAEDAGIFSLLVEYCLEYQKRGLSDIPAAIQQSTDDYQAESDPLNQFILDSCIESANATVKGADLYKAYISWADSQGLKERERLTNNAFGRRMSSKYQNDHARTGKVYHGIGLRVTDYSKLGDGLDTENESQNICNPREGTNTLNPSQSVTPSHLASKIQELGGIAE